MESECFQESTFWKRLAILACYDLGRLAMHFQFILKAYPYTCKNQKLHLVILNTKYISLYGNKSKNFPHLNAVWDRRYISNLHVIGDKGSLVPKVESGQVRKKEKSWVFLCHTPISWSRHFIKLLFRRFELFRNFGSTILRLVHPCMSSLTLSGYKYVGGLNNSLV